jgi:hypothetical protein
MLVDRFTQDQSLNPGLWVVNGPVGTKVGKNLTSPPSSLVTPTLAFSPQNGLGMTGVNGSYQAAAIESRAAFVPPFTVKAEVMPAGGAGTGVALILCDLLADDGIGMAGRLDPGDGPAGIGYIAPKGPEGAWTLLGTLFQSPQPNTWYTLTISVDDASHASLTVSSGASVIGQAPTQLGKFPLYIVLAQSEGAGTSPGAGQSNWRSVEVVSGARTQASRL